MEVPKKARYLCNGEKECCTEKGCYKNGGDCRYTKDVKFAKNFKQKFERQDAHYWEKEDASTNETPSTD